MTLEIIQPGLRDGAWPRGHGGPEPGAETERARPQGLSRDLMRRAMSTSKDPPAASTARLQPVAAQEYTRPGGWRAVVGDRGIDWGQRRAGAAVHHPGHRRHVGTDVGWAGAYLRCDEHPAFRPRRIVHDRGLRRLVRVHPLQIARCSSTPMHFLRAVAPFVGMLAAAVVGAVMGVVIERLIFAPCVTGLRKAGL